jgi:hypothetical protein
MDPNGGFPIDKMINHWLSKPREGSPQNPSTETINSRNGSGFSHVRRMLFGTIDLHPGIDFPLE